MAPKLVASPTGLDGLGPDRLSFVQAAAVPINYLTAAYGLIELAALREGQHLLVLVLLTERVPLP